ncbi:unnamed protein product [Boreogadus saida]
MDEGPTCVLLPAVRRACRVPRVTVGRTLPDPPGNIRWSAACGRISHEDARLRRRVRTCQSAIDGERNDDAVKLCLQQGKTTMSKPRGANESRQRSYKSRKDTAQVSTPEEVFQEVQSLVTSCSTASTSLHRCAYGADRLGAKNAYTWRARARTACINQAPALLLSIVGHVVEARLGYRITVSMVEIYKET